jgi:hypothetical protein
MENRFDLYFKSLVELTFMEIMLWFNIELSLTVQSLKIKTASEIGLSAAVLNFKSKWLM